MTKLIYSVLLLAVCYVGAKAGAACFLNKLTGCYTKVEINNTDHDFILCKQKEVLLSCFRESAVECSVDKRYNFDHLEKVYNEFCREGSDLNLKMKKHKECMYDTLIKSTFCVQDIIDFVLHHKDLTPEVILELGKLTCRERIAINQCYFGFIKKNCGEEAYDIFKIYSDSSEHVNELICSDIMKE